MKPSDLVSTIKACIQMCRAAFVWGAAGIGKSTLFRKIAADNGMEFCDFRMVYRDAVDMIGLPFAVDGITRYNLPAGLPTDPNWKGIILFDEWNSAPPQTQTPGYQLFAERRIGDFSLPKDAHIFAAGNRTSDRGVTHKIPDPLIDRWFNLYLESDAAEWCLWALANGICPEIVAFVRFRPALLHAHDPARACHAYATPRGYEAVSDVIKLALPAHIEADLIRGRIGDAQAGELLAFLKLFRGMVSPDQILVNPLKADVPTNSGILYALAEALARRASLKNFDAVMSYAKRMPSEYAQALVSSATALTPALCNTSEFIAWASANT